MKIIFMGTPDFAVASLAALLDAGMNVVAVVTTPDKPAGRGQKMHESAVKQYALAKNIPVLQPVKLKDPDFVEALKSFNADLQVVVAFRMLPEIVWNMPPKGTINLHASLLPDYRGAAPINWAVINGEQKSGVSTFLLQHEIDTGDILFSEEVSIAEDDTAGILHDKLMNVGATLLVRTVEAIARGEHQGTPQQKLLNANGEIREPKMAPKIFKDTCKIDWNKPAIEVHNHIRGLSPYPAAYTTLQEKTLKIFASSIVNEVPRMSPGSVSSDGKTYLRFATNDAFIDVQELQMEGKKRMTVTEFLRGFRL